MFFTSFYLNKNAMGKTNRLRDTTPDFLSGFTRLAKISPEVTHETVGV